ncbi:hypothetical protein FA13DRAFT_1714402 [Coprinellus micaceus]|uniref:Uncharacterized protein n=1 Tax=Coprinellus micaceus TaxID=71717 RepID=A0A4Y7SSY1_COPMI|nr:hypothetical protein FA13DRAFT_1714402 [Coprinellus micaceus]
MSRDRSRNLLGLPGFSRTIPYPNPEWLSGRTGRAHTQRPGLAAVKTPRSHQAHLVGTDFSRNSSTIHYRFTSPVFTASGQGSHGYRSAPHSVHRRDGRLPTHLNERSVPKEARQEFSHDVYPPVNSFEPNSTPLQLAAVASPRPHPFSNYATSSTARAGSSSDWQQGPATSATPLRHALQDDTYGVGNDSPRQHEPASHPSSLPMSSIQHLGVPDASFGQARGPSPLPTQAQSSMFTAMAPHSVTTSWQQSDQTDRPDPTSTQTSTEETRGDFLSADFHLAQTPSAISQSFQHAALQGEERTGRLVDQTLPSTPSVYGLVNQPFTQTAPNPVDSALPHIDSLPLYEGQARPEVAFDSELSIAQETFGQDMPRSVNDGTPPRSPVISVDTVGQRYAAPPLAAFSHSLADNGPHLRTVIPIASNPMDVDVGTHPVSATQRERAFPSPVQPENGGNIELRPRPPSRMVSSSRNGVAPQDHSVNNLWPNQTWSHGSEEGRGTFIRHNQGLSRIEDHGDQGDLQGVSEQQLAGGPHQQPLFIGYSEGDHSGEEDSEGTGSSESDSDVDVGDDYGYGMMDFSSDWDTGARSPSPPPPDGVQGDSLAGPGRAPRPSHLESRPISPRGPPSVSHPRPPSQGSIETLQNGCNWQYPPASSAVSNEPPASQPLQLAGGLEYEAQIRYDAPRRSSPGYGSSAAPRGQQVGPHSLTSQSYGHANNSALTKSNTMSRPPTRHSPACSPGGHPNMDSSSVRLTPTGPAHARSQDDSFFKQPAFRPPPHPSQFQMPPDTDMPPERPSELQPLPSYPNYNPPDRISPVRYLPHSSTGRSNSRVRNNTFERPSSASQPPTNQSSTHFSGSDPNAQSSPLHPPLTSQALPPAQGHFVPRQPTFHWHSPHPTQPRAPGYVPHEEGSVYLPSTIRPHPRPYVPTQNRASITQPSVQQLSSNPPSSQPRQYTARRANAPSLGTGRPQGYTSAEAFNNQLPPSGRGYSEPQNTIPPVPASTPRQPPSRSHGQVSSCSIPGAGWEPLRLTSPSLTQHSPPQPPPPSLFPIPIDPRVTQTLGQMFEQMPQALLSLVKIVDDLQSITRDLRHAPEVPDEVQPQVRGPAIVRGGRVKKPRKKRNAPLERSIQGFWRNLMANWKEPNFQIAIKWKRGSGPVEVFQPSPSLPPRSHWNIAMMKFFFRLYFTSNDPIARQGLTNIPAFENTYLARFNSWRKAFHIDRSATEEDKERAKSIKRRASRKRDLHTRRVEIARKRADCHRHIDMLEAYGVDGMTSDESEHEQDGVGIPQYRVLVKDWRHPAAAACFDDIDGLDRSKRFRGPGKKAKTGARPRNRVRGSKLSTSLPVPNLPYGYYNPEWLKSHLYDVEPTGDPTESYDFSHTIAVIRWVDIHFSFGGINTFALVSQGRTPEQWTSPVLIDRCNTADR